MNFLRMRDELCTHLGVEKMVKEVTLEFGKGVHVSVPSIILVQTIFRREREGNGFWARSQLTLGLFSLLYSQVRLLQRRAILPKIVLSPC